MASLNGHEFEQTPGDNEGQGRLVCYRPWGLKELDVTEQLNNNKLAGVNNKLAGFTQWLRLSC